MIAHIVTFEFVPNAASATIEEFHQALADMRLRLGNVIVTYLHGSGLGLREGTVDYGIVSIVPDEAALHAYLDDDGHKAVTAKFAPLLFAQRQAVQIDIGAGTS